MSTSTTSSLNFSTLRPRRSARVLCSPESDIVEEDVEDEADGELARVLAVESCLLSPGVVPSRAPAIVRIGVDIGDI